MSVILKPLAESDFPVVKEIYDWYIVNSTATFHTEPISVDELKSFIYIGDARFCSFLVEVDGSTVGYSYLTRYKNRQAYDRTAEITLYLKHGFTGKGIGTAVVGQMEQIARQGGIKTLLAIVTGENDNSIRLFEKNGYGKCAHFKRVGEKFGRVLDVLGFQKELE
ncbi:MAG: GNAT family N-acetyltransferase [Breznakibacter sp.]